MSDLVKNLAMFGASGALLGGRKSGFADAKQEESSGGIGFLIFIAILLLVTAILLIVSTYKLTNSGLQTFLCFLFGLFYIVIAYIYYGMAGYKFAKK
jgi:hypothetical protein